MLILERTVERKCTQGIDCKKTSLLYSAKMKKLEDKEVEKPRRGRKKRWTESHYSILRARMLKGEDKSERPMKKINKLLKRAKLKVYDQSWKEEREFRKPTQENKQEEESPILKDF